ncbi:hypothetical protein I588_03087 [Enterococcus pallens ATCC BAA-351]|uniref:Uncharacterized protein n=1 Tax=Enterococcus pallens ATCC BAA-351 TaxID=1158607 RepID=R2SI63_9ENTE|nr:hypothetical protein UAU_04739 [Enterococcus pallens ATCC BAA-351]EOU18098.1 hypothetical protein I588_03087 [Enterococcus pallens ATCC BAA-351]
MKLYSELKLAQARGTQNEKLNNGIIYKHCCLTHFFLLRFFCIIGIR